MTAGPPQGRVAMDLRDGVLVVDGEIDGESARALEERLRAAGTATGGHRLDLTGVAFIDSRGIETLFRLAYDGLEITVAAGSLLERVLHTVAVDRVAKVCARP